MDKARGLARKDTSPKTCSVVNASVVLRWHGQLDAEHGFERLKDATHERIAHGQQQRAAHAGALQRLPRPWWRRSPSTVLALRFAARSKRAVSSASSEISLAKSSMLPSRLAIIWVRRLTLSGMESNQTSWRFLRLELIET